MRKIFTIILLFTSISLAGTGWFQDYVIINQDGGGDLYYWIGADPSFGTPFAGHNFGVISSSSTLVITGADMRYWSDNQDRTGGAYYWQITLHGVFPSSQNEVIWTQSGPSGNNYQGTWSGTINLLNGLVANTSYDIHIWAKSWGTSQGDSWLSNGGANYIATFTTDGSVPVELTSFSAITIGKEVKLNWKTSTEVNNYGFEIFRSTQNDKYNWTKIGFVNGYGNSNSPKSYSFTDQDVSNGINSYRLKQIDTDGKFDYSKEIQVTIDNLPTKFELSQNYPNPFNPSTVIQYALPSEEFVQLKVFSVLGNEISTLVNEVQEAGNYKVEFNASRINASSSGVYFYRLEAGSFIDSRKMILVK